MLPDNHSLYLKFERNLYNLSLSNLIRETEHLNVCIGITQPDPNHLINFQKHIVPRKFDFTVFNKNQVFTKSNQDEYNRAPDCYILVDDPNPCPSCSKFNQKCVYESNRKQVKLTEPAKLNAPIKHTRPERLKLTIQHHRLQCKQLEEEINNMKLSLEKKVNLSIQNLIKILSNCLVVVIKNMFHHS